MSTPRLLHVVPEPPPAAEGVTATATVLADALGALGAARSDFLALGPGAPAALRHDAARIADRIAELAPTHLLVHYVNYAYDRHGCPEALVAAIERWSAGTPGHTLTYFHEVHADGPPWTRTFWVAGRQRRLAARLAGASALAATSLDIYAERLHALGHRGRVHVQPIPSTVGEIERPLSLAERASELVVFGGAGRRAAAYGEQAAELVRACAALACRTVVDIGPGNVAPDSVDGRPVERLGAVEAPIASARLAAAAGGFVAYSLDFLAKSSIFAAYTAHGLCAIATGRRRTRTSPPEAGVHFWDPRAGELATDTAQAVASRGHAWYREHDVASLAAVFAGELGRR